MRNKKLLILIAVMLLVVFTVSLALVACKPTDEPEGPSGGIPSGSEGGGSGGDDDDDYRPTLPPIDEKPTPSTPIYAMSFRRAVEYFVESTPSNYLSINFEGGATLNNKKYVMSLKGNISDNDSEVAGIFKQEGSDTVAFAFYIVGEKFFIQFTDDKGESFIYNVAEIDVNYLTSIIGALPEALGNLIDKYAGDYASLISMAIDLLLGGFAPEIKYANNNGVETFEIGIDVQGFLDPILTLIDPEDGIVGGFLPEGFDISFVSQLLELVPLINGNIKSTVDNGRLSEFSVELYDNDPKKDTYKDVLIGFESAITFSSNKLSVDIPDKIKNYEVLSLSLGNINADFTLDIDTKGEPFDIGALLDVFLPTPMFGEGILMLSGDADYHLDVQISVDANLSGSAEDNNYINAVLRSGEGEDATEIVRANYLDGKIYVKALAKGINGFADGGLNVAIPLDLRGYIQDLVKLVTDAIDGFLGTKFRPETASAYVLSASVNAKGETIISESLQDALISVLSFVDNILNLGDNGFSNSIEISGDSVTIVVDDALFSAISQVAKIDLDLPIFGDLVIGLFGGGIEYVEVTAMDILTLRADHFLLGKSNISREYVEKSIGDVDDYGEDIESIMLSFALSLLSDLELSLDLDMSTINTTVNMTSIINSIMAVANSSTYLKFPINLDLSQYDGKFKLRVASNYEDETGDGRLLLELITPDGETLVSAYNENSNTYVDLSGLGFMKFCLTGVNFMQIIRGLLGAEVIVEDLMEEVTPVMAMSANSSVEIDSDSLDVAVNSYFVTMLLRRFTMDLGMDVDLDAHLNFNGSVSMNLGLGDTGLGNTARFALTMSLGKESETEHRITEKIEGLPKDEYGEYESIGAEALVDSILVAEKLNLTIDLYNQNVDESNHNNNQTRIVIRNAKVATAGQTERLSANGMEVPYKAIVFLIYAGWTDVESETLLTGYIDFDAKKIQIKGTKRMLDVNVLVTHITGEIIDVPIDVDIKGILVKALSGLFGDSADDGSYGGVIEVPEGALPPQKPHRCSHVCPICGKCLDKDCNQSSCASKCEAVDGVHPTPEEPTQSQPTPPIEEILNGGIKITLTGSMDVDIDANINGAYISKLLKDTLTKVFADLDISSVTKNDAHKHQNVTYNNTNGGTFYNSLWTNVIAPIIAAQVPAIGGLISGAAGLVAKGPVQETVQRFLPISDVENLSVNVSLTDGKLANITAIGSNTTQNTNLGYGVYIFNKKADEVISWENQATSIYFNPTLGEKLVDKFEKKARKHVVSNWEIDSWADISWKLKSDDTNLDGMDLATFSDNIAKDINAYADGDYVFEGSAWDKTINVTVTLHTASVVSVKNMQVKAMRDVPTYVTAVFDDGSERLLTDVDITLVDKRTNVEDLVDADTKEPMTDQDGNLIDYNASVKLGGKTYNFRIDFEEEDITLDTLVLNAFDYIDKINLIENSGVMRVKINDSFYRNLPATFDFSMFTDENNEDFKTRQDLQRPATYEVNVHVGIGTVYERDMVLKVEFTPFTLYYIERNGLHCIQTDFIEDAKGESFPEQIVVVGYNGKDWLKYTVDAEWDTSTVTIDLKGGQYFASAIINKGKYNEWRMESIEVEVLPSDIVDLYGNSKSVVLDWKYYFYGNVPIDNCYPTLLNFKTSGGVIKRDVPVTIDLSSIFADEATVREAMEKGMTFECPLSVDVKKNSKGDSLFKTKIQVVVPSVKMSLEKSEININYNDYLKYGKSAYFADNMEILLGKDKVNANVTWFTDEVIFNKDGTYSAIVYIDLDGDYQQSCEVTVNITGAPTV